MAIDVSFTTTLILMLISLVIGLITGVTLARPRVV